MKPEDFDEVLDSMPLTLPSGDDYRFEEMCHEGKVVLRWVYDYANQIRTALRIAKAVGGEPSEKAIESGMSDLYESFSWPEEVDDGDLFKASESLYKAMRDQMIKEAVG